MGEAPETGHSPPLDWPGRLWLDGRTPVQVGDFAGQAEAGRGPMSKAEIPVFHNPAMTGSRTRSVLLLDQCLREDWLTKPGAKIRVLDGLAANREDNSAAENAAGEQVLALCRKFPVYSNG